MSITKREEIVDKSYDYDLDSDTRLAKDVDVDLNADVDISKEYAKSYEVDLDADASFVGIGVLAYTEHPDVSVTYKEEKTSTEHDTDYDYDYDKDVDIDHNTTSYTKTVTETESEHLSTTVNETWNINVNVEADSIVDWSHITDKSENVTNDVDVNDLINVDAGGRGGPKDHSKVGDNGGAPLALEMDDFAAEVLTIGESFNGLGNDGQISVNQSNDLDDDDEVSNTSATYQNHQAPDVTLNAGGSLHATHDEGGHLTAGYSEYASGSVDAVAGAAGYGNYHGYKYVKAAAVSAEAAAGSSGHLDAGYWSSAALGAALYLHGTASAPTNAFETVTAQGGSANSGDGIAAADLHGASLDAEGNAIIEGSTEATAGAEAVAASFNVDVETGGNNQINTSSLNITGGNSVDAGDVHGSVTLDSNEPANVTINEADESLAIRGSTIEDHSENNVNDIDVEDLINVEGGFVELEDFDLDVTTIGDAFNGVGNDYQLDVSQANDLADNDTVMETTSMYDGAGWNAPFQSVSATGGHAYAADGIGHATGNHVSLDAGGNAAVVGSAAASADAIASASAFNVSASVGANVQYNQFNANVVGNDSAIVDDIGAGLTA